MGFLEQNNIDLSTLVIHFVFVMDAVFVLFLSFSFPGFPHSTRGLVWMPSVVNDIQSYSIMNNQVKEKKKNLRKLGSDEHGVVVEEWFHEFMKDLDYLIDREGGKNDDHILLISMSVKSIIGCYVEFDQEVGYCQGK